MYFTFSLRGVFVLVIVPCNVVWMSLWFWGLDLYDFYMCHDSLKFSCLTLYCQGKNSADLNFQFRLLVIFDWGCLTSSVPCLLWSRWPQNWLPRYPNPRNRPLWLWTSNFLSIFWQPDHATQAHMCTRKYIHNTQWRWDAKDFPWNLLRINS